MNIEEAPKLMLLPLKIHNSTESNPSKLCIWCKKTDKKNVAHIISKTIINLEKRNNKLKYSVCINCNAFLGRDIEDWFFKYSPIGMWKEQMLGATIFKNLQFVPNLIFVDSCNEWMIVNHSQKDPILPTQLILKDDGTFKLFHKETNNEEEYKSVCENFKTNVQQGNFTIYKTHLLEENFDPRIFEYKNKFVIVVKNDSEFQHFRTQLIDSINNLTVEKIISNLTIGEASKLQIHFRWSVKKYIRLCTKIAFEFLSIIKGGDFVLNSSFDSLRDNIMNPYGTDDDIRIKYEDGKGYAVNKFAFKGWIIVGDFEYEKKLSIPTMVMKNASEYTATVVLYKYEEYLCAMVKLFNIDYCAIIIGKMDEYFGGVYAITFHPVTKDFRILKDTNFVSLPDDYLVLNKLEKNIVDKFN